MLSKHTKLFFFLVTLPSIIVNQSGAQRSQVDANFRGHSFGLENFLFQTYEGTEIRDPIRNVKPKRMRPPVNVYRTTSSDRGQTYGLENLSAQVYESNRLKPILPKPNNEVPRRRPVEPEPNRPKENLVLKKEPTTEIPQEPEAVQPETSTQDTATERIRKRIMMRRRRKRPQSVIQAEGNSEVTGNAIPKPVRIPVFPQVSKVAVRPNLSEAPQRPKPVAVTTQREVSEEVSEQEVTTEIEKSTVSTTREPSTTEKSSTINLKTFLKQQTETLSLSELLQIQNLSLADLLRGSKDASEILKAKQAISTTTSAPIPDFKQKTLSRVDVEVPEPPAKIEIQEVTTSRPNYSKFQPKIPRIKNGDQNKFKPENKTQDKIQKPEVNIEETPRPVKKPNGAFDPQTRLNELRLKLRNFQKKTNPPEVLSEVPEKEETTEPLSPITEASSYKKNRVPFKSTNNPELSLIVPTKARPDSENIKRPERISNWINRLPSLKRFGQERITQGVTSMSKPFKVSILNEEVVSSTQEPEEEKKTTPTLSTIYEEIKKPEPKDDLIELLKSGQNADRLQKILYSRNMTIQELLDNREKPPLQMNFTELFSNHQREEIFRSSPAPIFESVSNIESVDENEFKVADAISYDEPYAEESAPTIARVELIANRAPKQYDLPISEKDPNADLNLEPDDLKADTSNAENSALWKVSEKSIYYGNTNGYSGVTPKQETEKPKVEVKTTELSESDVVWLETLRRNQNMNRKFKLDFSDFVKEEPPETEDIEKSYIPPAVKSAIIASGVVMGIALFVFIAIFATCGWRQRQIRLKGSSSILGDSLAKSSDKSKRVNTLSPVSFKDTNSYKKTIDFDDETSESGSSHTSSYLWSTLKNTFISRTSTLKSRLEKEEKMREDKLTLRRNESRRKVESRSDDRPSTFQTHEDRFAVKKIDRDRNVINTSFNFKRSSSNNNIDHFNECIHGY